MKKTLLALAAVAAMGVASAQVTLGGSIAVAVQNTVAASAAKFDLADADINVSAKEDLGGGMTVSAGTSISNEAMRGNGTTANNTKLVLDGGFGTLEYKNELSGSAKLSAGVSVEDDMSDLMGGYVTQNAFSYTLPAIAGVRVGFEYAADDAAALKAGGAANVFGTAEVGPLSVYAENGGASEVWDVRVGMQAGPATVGVRTTKEKTSELAVTIPAGAMTFGMHYATKDNGDKATGVNAAYALSKQTSVQVGYVTGKGNGFDGNNYRVQLKKAF